MHDQTVTMHFSLTVEEGPAFTVDEALALDPAELEAAADWLFLLMTNRWRSHCCAQPLHEELARELMRSQ